jgi:hypothetical protein
MSWVRFWSKGRCSSGLNDVDSEYVWLDSTCSDEILMDEARERAPEWRKLSERCFDYGYEYVTELPENVKTNLVKEHEATIRYSTRMLGILRGTDG